MFTNQKILKKLSIYEIPILFSFKILLIISILPLVFSFIIIFFLILTLTLILILISFFRINYLTQIFFQNRSYCYTLD
jgi:hypothetical protein